MKSRAEHVDKERKLHPTNKTLIMEQEFVWEICETHTEKTNDSHDLDMSGDKLHHYLEDLAQPCDEMIVKCYFEGHYR